MSESVRNDSGLYFSPQPFPPALLGQRHLDSTLFDLRQLDAHALHASPRLPAQERARENAGSGLIDVKSLVAAAEQQVPRVPVVPPGGLLVGLSATQAPATSAAQGRATQRWLAAICVTLATIFVVLAVAVLV